MGVRSRSSEAEVQRLLERLRFEDHRIGYDTGGAPDFALTRDEEIVAFVEVKRTRRDRLRPDQERFRRFCDRQSIPYLEWRPEDGDTTLTRFLENVKSAEPGEE